jgi:hypothetical protein
MADIGSRAVAMARGPDFFQAAAELRPRVVQLIALTDAAEAELARLDEPDLAVLELPPELGPAAIKAAVRRLNRTIRTAYQAYLPVLDAIARHDMAAARGGAARAMVSMQEILSSQLLLVRAQQATLPSASSAWSAVNVQILYLRMMERYAKAMPGGRGAATGLAHDLRTIADELDATAAEGSARAEREIAQAGEFRSRSERQGDTGSAAVAGRSLRVVSESNALFPLAREFASLLRSQASRLGNTPSSVALMSAIAETYPVRDRILAIVAAMSAGILQGH